MHRRIHVLIAALLLALVIALPAAAEHPDRASYRFGGDLPQADRDEIRIGFTIAQRYLPDVAPFVVRAGDRVRPPDAGSRGPYEYDYVADAGDHRVEVYTSGDAYRESSPSEVEETMVHEYYHLVQEELMRRGDPRATEDDDPFVPLWIVEGTAEWVSVRVAAANGLDDYEKARAVYVGNVKESDVSLDDFDSQPSDDGTDAYDEDPYSLGFLAVELLASQHGGQAALDDFWVQVGVERDWRSAFRKSFGVSSTSFVGEFARWRKAGFPTPSGFAAMPTPAPLP